MPPEPTNAADRSPSFDPVELLAERFVAAIRLAYPDLTGEANPLIAANKNPKLGDFQCNAAMGLSKRVGKPPREVATALLAHVKLDDLCEPLGSAAVAGPGFINLTLRPAAIAELLAAFDNGSLGIAKLANPQTVVVDLCGVNLAKEMHVGHLRSTIIGDAVARVFERLGWKVVRQNHLGDWGLPIAMVTGKLMREIDAGRADLATLRLADTDRLYKLAQAECKTDTPIGTVVKKYAPQVTPKLLAEWPDELGAVERAEAALTEARKTLVQLQSKDAATLTVWQRIVDITIAACAENCRNLVAIVLPEHTAGESSYADELAGVVDDLLSRGIAEVNDGAVIVRLDKPEWGNIPEPCLIRKSDGGFLYATTDLAGVRRRVRKFGGSRLVYCVDARQSLHFQQVFAACNRAGYSTGTLGAPASTMIHAAFGMVLGEDNRPFKTRSGENVKLADLITEATDRSAAEIRKKNPDMAEADIPPIARAVGIAAIKYTDLSVERIKDYVFSFDRMVAFEGNTGPYLLYAYARTRSIARKAAAAGHAAGHGSIVLADAAEKSLALAILRYPEALRQAADNAEPHRVCQFLYDLAGAYSSFYTNCPILQAPDAATRASRLRLCDLTSRVLADGLTCLGIPLVERM